MKTLPGCAYALLARSYFRWRHIKTPKIKIGHPTYMMHSKKEWVGSGKRGSWVVRYVLYLVTPAGLLQKYVGDAPITLFKTMTDIARDYVRKARGEGWRGNFREAAAEWKKLKHLYHGGA